MAKRLAEIGLWKGKNPDSRRVLVSSDLGILVPLPLLPVLTRRSGNGTTFFIKRIKYKKV